MSSSGKTGKKQRRSTPSAPPLESAESAAPPDAEAVPASEPLSEEFTIHTPMVLEALGTILRGCPPPQGGPDLLKILDDDSWHVVEVENQLVAVDDENLNISRLTESGVDVETLSDSEPDCKQEASRLRQQPGVESGQGETTRCCTRRKGSHAKRMPRDFLLALRRSQKEENKKKRKERFRRFSLPEDGVARKSERRRSSTS